MKLASYAAIILGVVALIGGVYEQFIHHGTHHFGVIGLGLGAVLLIAGIVGAFVLKPAAA